MMKMPSVTTLKDHICASVQSDTQEMDSVAQVCTKIGSSIWFAFIKCLLVFI